MKQSSIDLAVLLGAMVYGGDAAACVMGALGKAAKTIRACSRRNSGLAEYLARCDAFEHSADPSASSGSELP